MLRERILDTLKNTAELDQRKLSQVAQVSQPAMSRYLNGFEEIKFESALRLVKYLYPEQEREVMSEYIPTQKSMNARHALEYCAVTRNWGILKQTIELLSASNNPVDKEWAAMYEFILMRNQKTLPPLEQLKRVEMFKPKEKEIHIIKSIIKVYIYYDLMEQRTILLQIKGIENMINTTINHEFIKNSLTLRLNLILSYVNLQRNNLIQTRKYCYSIIPHDLFYNSKATAYHNLGVSFMFESYEESLHYLNTALDCYIDHNTTNKNNKNTKLCITFLKSYWGIKYDYTESLEDHRTILNYIYYLIKKEEFLLADKQLKQLTFNNLIDWDKAFYYYYKGLITNDIANYLSSIKIFLNLNDHFHLQLPLKEAQKLLGSDAILNLLP